MYYTYSYPTSLRFILILFLGLGLGFSSCLFPSDFPIKMYGFLICDIHAARPICIVRHDILFYKHFCADLHRNVHNRRAKIMVSEWIRNTHTSYT